MKRVVWVVVILAIVSLACSTERFLTPETPVVSKPANTPTPFVLPTAVPETAVQPVTDEEALLVNIYERANPGVVNIDISGSVQGQLTELGSGSGFVIDKQGHIVTNNHVVADAQEMRVTFWDGHVVKANLIATDPYSDLAVIQVDVPESRLAPLELGESDELQVGQRVVAIGNPFGLRGSMSAGIISALARSLPADLTGEGSRFQNPDIIQTDAAINPGNSGGPLLNLRGQVIGVNTAIRTDNGSNSNSGVGFAVPSHTVKRVVPQLIEKGQVAYPYLGVSVDNRFTLHELALETQMPVESGVLIDSVVPGEPADQAGLRGSTRQVQVQSVSVNIGGDIITAIDGTPIDSFDEMIIYLTNKTEVGQTVTLTIVRDGKEIQVPVKLSDRTR
jgi:2-alkenal reductase